MSQSTAEFIQERVYLKGVSPRTVIWYRGAFKSFDGALESKQSVIARIAELKSRGLSNISINTALRCINAYFHWRDGKGEKCSPQCEHLHVPRLKEEQKVLEILNSSQVSHIVGCSCKTLNDRRIHTFICVLLDTGIRLTEALSLRREDIDFDNLVIKIQGKGNKQRLVPFSAEGRRVLFRWMTQQKSSYVFGTRSGRGLSQRNAGRDMRTFGRKAKIVGVRFSPHTIRHTFACTYLRNGGDLFTLSRILGHRSISTTQIYLKSVGMEQISEAHKKFSPLSARR